MTQNELQCIDMFLVIKEEVPVQWVDTPMFVYHTGIIYQALATQTLLVSIINFSFVLVILCFL